MNADLNWCTLIFLFSNLKKKISVHQRLNQRSSAFKKTFAATWLKDLNCYITQTQRTYYNLQPPKRPFQLPNYLEQHEVIKLFQAVDNIKHKCILLTIYSSGLRLSEVVNLRIADIRRADKSIFVKAGKGKKDRYTLLSDTLLTELETYYKQYKPSFWLFEGQTGGQYSPRSVQKILRDAVCYVGTWYPHFAKIIGSRKSRHYRSLRSPFKTTFAASSKSIG